MLFGEYKVGYTHWRQKRQSRITAVNLCNVDTLIFPSRAIYDTSFTKWDGYYGTTKLGRVWLNITPLRPGGMGRCCVKQWILQSFLSFSLFFTIKIHDQIIDKNTLVGKPKRVQLTSVRKVVLVPNLTFPQAIHRLQVFLVISNTEDHTKYHTPWDIGVAFGKRFYYRITYCGTSSHPEVR